MFVKLGGSAITDKDKHATAKHMELARIAEEIASARQAKGFELVVVHGGGSFGHVTAKKHGLADGFRTEEQKRGFAETHKLMVELNQMVCDEFLKHGVPAIGVPPIHLVLQDRKRITHFDTRPVELLLAEDFVPVLFGDVVFDIALNGSICSGDQIISYLAKELRPKQIVLGTDVDGIFTADPKTDKKAELIEEVTNANLPEVLAALSGAKTHDVTGGMKGKVSELIELSKSGDVLIINASKPGRFRDALLGKEVVGTRIRV